MAPELAEPGPDDTTDHDGLTQVGDVGDPEPAAGPAGQPAAVDALPRPVARLHFSHGPTVDVDRVVVVGRAPVAARSSAADPVLVEVPSPQQEVSSTHLEIRPGAGADHGAAVVLDLGSTNGTVVVQPGMAPDDVRPGIPVQLLPGAVVDLGDGVSIRVTGP